MKNIRQNFVLVFLQLIIAIAVFIACGSSKQANIERGTGYNFEAGHPEFRTSAFGFIDEDDGPTLELRVEIVKNSLSFKQDGDSLSARVGIDFQVQDISDPENIIATKHIEKTITVKDEQSLSTREIISVEHSLQVTPSRYQIVANVQDLNSNKDLTQTAETYIPEIETGAYTLSDIQLYGKQNEQSDWIPINTYDVKGKVDSLRFVFQLISSETDNKKMTLNSRLLRIESDTSYPRPMHYSNYSPSSIEYKGIDYNDETELQSTQRILTDYRSIFIEYKFENQERGNYRFEVTAQKEENEEEEELFKGRAFGVKSNNYPAIQTPHEMAKPLVYLMSEGDYEELMEISDPDSLKKEIDRFWLKEIGNTGQAKAVIELYYDRVEQANKQFSNFKEGWKTDLGMIYILFGPPWYTHDRLKEMYWYYSYNREDPEYTYYFEQPKLKNKFYPFYHYLLQRQNFYHTAQYSQRQLWLSGQILTRRLF
jgi:GWxTD domain-containing protein